MARPRKHSPALYELIGTRPRGVRPVEVRAPVTAEDQVAHAPPAEDEERPPLLGPGRVVRLPVGFFFFGAAVVIAAGLGGYAMGYKVSEHHFEAELQAQAAGSALTPSDPLLDQDITPGLLNPSNGSSGANRPAQVPREPAGQEEGGPGQGRGQVIRVWDGTPDPRSAGLNYLIVFREARDEAVAAADFLSERGYDVAVVPSGKSLAIVVSLSGFEGSVREGGGPSHIAAIKQLGKEYRRAGGAGDFDSAYWDRFDG
ncbi:MAG: hypothetical protein AAFX05_09390 [Planctomycetota bacterium]